MLVTATDRFPSRAIVIAAGIGAFSPRRLPQPCAEPWYGRGIYDIVTDPETFRGQRVVIIGGGDSAFDWGTQLLSRAQRVTIVHRSDRFRAHGATVAEYQSAVSAGRAALFTFHELHDISCANGSERFTHVVFRDVKNEDQTRELEADVVLPMLGFVSDIGPLAEWGLTLGEGRDRGEQHDGDGARRHLRGGRRDDLSGKAQADRDGVRRSRDGGESGGALDLSGEESRAGALVEHGVVWAV